MLKNKDNNSQWLYFFYYMIIVVNYRSVHDYFTLISSINYKDKRNMR